MPKFAIIPKNTKQADGVAFVAPFRVWIGVRIRASVRSWVGSTLAPWSHHEVFSSRIRKKKKKNSPAARTSYRTLTGVMVLARGAEWKHLHVFRCNLSIRIRNNILNNLPMIDYESVRRRKQSSNGA